jgi:hypothetical protein
MKADTPTLSPDRPRPKRHRWLTRSLVLVGAALLLIHFLPPLAWPFFRVFGDALDWRLRSLAGWRAINCGRVAIRGNPASASDCVEEANSRGGSFYVRFDLRGFDSDVAAGLARTPAGKLIGFTFDGNPSGSGGTSLLGQRVTEYPCPEPIELRRTKAGRVTCFPPSDKPPNIMSPAFEPF